jgi:hypothetical protein
VNSSRFNYRIERIFIVDHISLLKPFYHESGLVPINRTIELALDLVHSFAINYIDPLPWWYQMSKSYLLVMPQTRQIIFINLLACR